MSKDKKQILVLGVLFAVILAVGAFQFMGGSKPKVAADKDDKKDKGTEVAVNDEKADPIKEAIVPLFTAPLVSRDPFVPQAVVLDEETTDPNQNTGIIKPPPMPNGNNGQGYENVGVVHPPVDGQIGLQPTDPPKDAWALRGVMMGAKTLAILEDAKGNQFLVKEGDSFNNGQTRVLSISKTNVQLMNNGTVTNLALLGGN